MKTTLTLLLLTLTAVFGKAQTNITISNLEARNIIHGTYNPSNYASSNPIINPNQITNLINTSVSADSLKELIIQFGSFETRNSGSDTVSNVRGIGAARRWVYSKMESYSAVNENRLKMAYLDFTVDMCGTLQHRNVLGILPGSDTSNHQLIIIEGHMDSRCDLLCDTSCIALGIEDNATGAALVMELARVLSAFTFKNTIVFMVNTGEEQGLFGGQALANYAETNGLPIKAVLNNDVIGGIICGNTSSAPSCPGLNDIDSTQVRLFSQGGFNSKHKQLVRFLKLEYTEMLEPLVTVPMQITVMAAEDRTGRGGDHIPFRQKGFPAMRFTSANEHGDASNGPGYTDRQHTSDDVLGVDTDNDNIIDSFFVDFNYLARNASINGVGAAMAAIGPNPVDLDAYTYFNPDTILVLTINDPANYGNYRVAVRSVTNDWDTVYQTSQLSNEFVLSGATNYYVSVASVDANGIESLFSREIPLYSNKLDLDEKQASEFELLQNKPNPFDEATIIGVRSSKSEIISDAFISVTDLNGKEIQRLPLIIEKGENEVVYHHGYGQVGVYLYTLVIQNQVIAQNKMIFAN